MKEIIKVSVILLLVSVMGLAGCEVKDAKSQNPSTRQVTEALPADTVLLVLPEMADVQTKQNTEKTGRLVNIDAQQKQLVINPGSGEIPIALSEVVNVKLEGEIKFYSNGQLVIRGNESTKNLEEIWQEIPLEAFTYEFGKLEAKQDFLKLDSFSQEKQNGIKMVANSAIFVVEEMQFNTNNTMTIKVAKQPR